MVTDIAMPCTKYFVNMVSIFGILLTFYSTMCKRKFNPSGDLVEILTKSSGGV